MIQRSGGTHHEPTYTLGAAVRLANHPPRPAGAVPSLGEHTDAVLDALSAEGNGGGAARTSASDPARRDQEHADGD
jgi:crotonobetainyl-CoA:carnitine CoA-transferase CaiB-like acyl-CoA transferase